MALLSNISFSGLQSKVALSIAIFAFHVVSHVGVGYVWYVKGKSSVDKDILTNTINQINTHQQELSKQQETFNKNVDNLNNTLSTNTQTVKIITNNTEREIEKTVYRDTVVPSSGMQLLADNASALNAKRVPGSALSKVQTTTNTETK